MQKFTEQDFANLEPRAQLYEVRVEIDFALRIFPNGSKTWVYIFSDRESVQRETLGVFPGMGVDQAYQALEAARCTTAKYQDEVLQREACRLDEVPMNRKSRVGRLSMIAAGLLVGLLVITYNMPMDGFMDGAKVGRTESVVAVAPKVISPKRETIDLVKVEPTEAIVAETSEAVITVVPEVLISTRETADLVKVKPTEAVVAETSEAVITVVPEVMLSKHETTDVAKVEPTVAAVEVAQKVMFLKPETVKSSPVPAAKAVRIERPAPVETEVSQLSNGLVKRALFTRGIEGREPVDRVDPLSVTWDGNDLVRQLYFFTEVSKLEGRTIYHRWELNGEVLAEIPFEVKSAWRWRVYSSKQILPTMQGEWQVSVVDDRGNTLHSEQFLMASGSDAGAKAVVLLAQ